MITEFSAAGAPGGQWLPNAVIIPKVTPRLKKIWEAAVDQQSGRSRRTDKSHSPMYAWMPSAAPGRVTALKKKTARRTRGRPMVTYAILPVHLIPNARHKP